MSNSNNNPNLDEFYVGYLPNLPPKVKRFLWILIPFLVIVLISLSILLPIVHNQYFNGNYTGFQEFEGYLVAKPVPHLVVPRSGETNEENAYSRYVLAATNKASVNPKVLEFDGKWVKLRAIPVFRDNMTLLAVSSKTPPEEIDALGDNSASLSTGQSLGEYSLLGEIIDTKCHLGVMNPGHTKTHRECAIRCISGGVPASLRIRDRNGDIVYLLLVDENGDAFGDRILNFVGEPVEVQGEVEKYGDLFVLKATNIG